MTQNPDNYQWLENLENPQVIKWARQKDKIARKTLKNLSITLRPRIAYYYAAPYIFQVRASENGYFILLRDAEAFKIKIITDEKSSKELVNSKKIGKDVVLRWLYTTKNGEIFAFSYSVGGSDEGFLRIVETCSGHVIDELKGRIGDIAWLSEEEYFYVKFYATEKTPDGVGPPAERVFLRENGKDIMVFGKGIPKSYFITLKRSNEGAKALLTVSYGWTRSDVYAGTLENPESWNLIYGKGDFMAYPIDYIHGKYYIASFDGNGKGRILAASDGGKIDEVVGELKYPLQEAVIYKEKLVANYLENASSVLKMFDLNGKTNNEIRVKPSGTIESLDSNGVKCVFKYESFLVPYRIYALTSDGLKILDYKEIGGDFTLEEFWVRSKDSTYIHGFKVEKTKKGSRKVLAYGYGGFAVPLTPRYYPHVIPFLEDGGTFVVANLRGGKEFGEEWHRNGMREKKQNVFDDFIAVLEFFKRENAKIVAMGVSNGGLLVGAILTQRPELLDGAVMGYPVLDMLRFHKLYIGEAWVPEYGNPDNPKDAEFLVKYSPYHNVTKKNYPPILLYTGLHDDRVHPAHAFKFAGKIEEVGSPCLLRVETKSGHSGATPKTKISEYSDIMAFVYNALGVGTP